MGNVQGRSFLLKDLLYVEGGIAVVRGLKSSLLLILNLFGIVDGFELFNFDLNLYRALGSER